MPRRKVSDGGYEGYEYDDGGDDYSDERRPSRAAKARAIALQCWVEEDEPFDDVDDRIVYRKHQPPPPPEPEPEPEPSAFENPVKIRQSKSERTIIVIGMSPESFTGEVLRIWPKRGMRKIRMVWINKSDPPPKLPDKWIWHEVHQSTAEALLHEAALGGKNTEAWGELFIIMGAGTSIQVRQASKHKSLYFSQLLLGSNVCVD